MRNISKVLVVIAVIAAIAIVITVTKAGKEGGNSSIPAQNSDGQTAQTQQPMDNIATSKIHQAVRPPLQSNLPPRHAVTERYFFSPRKKKCHQTRKTPTPNEKQRHSKNPQSGPPAIAVEPPTATCRH